MGANLASALAYIQRADYAIEAFFSRLTALALDAADQIILEITMRLESMQMLASCIMWSHLVHESKSKGCT